MTLDEYLADALGPAPELEDVEMEELDVPDDFWPPDAQLAYVYRVYDADTDRLLYIGQSIAPWERLRKHRRTSWWPARDRITLVDYPTVAAAVRAEAEAICAEDPPHNDATPRHASGHCQGPRCTRRRAEAHQRLAALLAAHGITWHPPDAPTA